MTLWISLITPFSYRIYVFILALSFRSAKDIPHGFISSGFDAYGDVTIFSVSYALARDGYANKSKN